jgi:hypothetical protein
MNLGSFHRLAGIILALVCAYRLWRGDPDRHPMEGAS